MEKLSKEEYRDKVVNIYNKSQDYYYENAFNINKFQKCHHFTEFYDVNITSFNKIMEGAKYFNNKGLDYYNPEQINRFRTLMVAWEDYVGEFNKNAMEEFSNYIEETNKIFENNKKRILFRLFQQNSKIAKILLIRNGFYEKDYISSQKHTRRFYEIGREIFDLDPEKDIENAVIFHMNSLIYDINQTVNFDGLDVTQNEVHKYKLFHYYVTNMYLALTALGKTDRLNEIAELEKIIMEEDLQRKKILLEKEEQKKLTLS